MKCFNKVAHVGFYHFVELIFFQFPLQLPPYNGAVLCGTQATDELPDGELFLSFIWSYVQGGQGTCRQCFPGWSYFLNKHSLTA